MAFVLHAIANTGGNNYFEIIGNQAANFSAGGYFQVRKSLANDGIYKISAVAPVNGYTRLSTATPIAATDLSGTLNGGVYTIQFTDQTIPGKADIVIPPSTFNNSATTLTLPSRGAFDYGERLVTNILHSLENFASTTPPTNPTIGQQWYDYPNRSMKVYVDEQWSSDANIGRGLLTFNDPQNNDSKIVVTASEGVGKESTGLTVYPTVDVAVGSPLFRVVASDNSVNLAVTRGDAVATNLRFVASSATTNEFNGKLAVGAPANSFSVGSVLNINGNMDVVGKIILDETAPQHGIIYRTGGSNISATDRLWQVHSSHVDAISLSNGTQEVARFGAINNIYTPSTLKNTLTVEQLTTMTDVAVTGTAIINTQNVATSTVNTLTVPLAFSATSTGTLLTGTLDANGKVVTNLPLPVSASDAVTKQYQDSLHFMSKLTDVDVTGVINQQSLTYDSTQSKWVDTTLTPDYISGIDKRIKDSAGSSVLAGTHVGITATYSVANSSLTLSANQQTVQVSGDASGTGSLDWSGTTTIPVTLKNSGAQSGTWSKVTVNAKGIVTNGTTLAASDIPLLDGAKLTTGILTLSTTGNAATASKLANSVTINGVSFDGSSNITVTDNTKLPLVGGSLSGKINGTAISMASYLRKCVSVDVSGTAALNCAAATHYNYKLTGATTLTIATMPSMSSFNDEMLSVVIRISQGSTANTLTWFPGISWLTPDAGVPATPAANKTTEFLLTTTDGTGTNWVGQLVASDGFIT